MSNGDFWTSAEWQKLNGNPTATPPKVGLLQSTMTSMQVAQQVFGATVLGSDNSIPADYVNLGTGIPTTGITRALVTLRKPFKLAPLHISDPQLVTASNQVKFAGQALALTEDRLFLQGKDAELPTGAQQVFVSDEDKLDKGLLGIQFHTAIRVPPSSPADRSYGVSTYKAVIQGMRKLTGPPSMQGGPFALILSSDIFADVNLPLNANPLVTAGSAIQKILGGGPLVMSPGMPEWTGLLVSLGANATTLYVGTAPVVEYNAYDGYMHSFSARESIQFVNTDPRALIRLEFMPPASVQKAES